MPSLAVRCEMENSVLLTLWVSEECLISVNRPENLLYVCSKKLVVIRRLRPQAINSNVVLTAEQEGSEIKPHTGERIAVRRR